MQAGANLPAVGGYNQAVILDAVRRSPDGVSRVELAESTGLSPQTVSNVTRRLLDEGFIVDAGTVSAGVGKPRTILRLDAGGRYAIGVHLDPTVITVVLLDLASNVVADRVIPTPESGEARLTITRIAETVDDLVAEAGADRRRIMGVGVAAPGPIDVAAGTVLNPPLLRGWRDVAIRDELADALDMPVLLEKDVTAAAVAELWAAGGADDRNAIFFYYGTGLGTGIILRNEVVRGVTGNAGDIAALTVSSADGEPRRPAITAMPSVLVDAAISRGVLHGHDGSLGAEEVRDLFGQLMQAASDGDEEAIAIMDAAADDIAQGLVQLANLLDVDRVYFGGPFFPAAEEFLLARIPDRVHGSPLWVLPHEIRFERSQFGDDVAAVGAASLVLDHAFSPRPEGLLITR
jgi:predicted NBD/HSP70 family sugar kinase